MAVRSLAQPRVIRPADAAWLDVRAHVRQLRSYADLLAFKRTEATMADVV